VLVLDVEDDEEAVMVAKMLLDLDMLGASSGGIAEVRWGCRTLRMLLGLAVLAQTSSSGTGVGAYTYAVQGYRGRELWDE
jgi:hypothetical protein